MDKQERAVQSEDSTPGRRLEAFIRQRWTRRQGGITKLATAIGSSTETMYSWFRGSAEPSMAHLRSLAAVLGVSRSEIVSVMDGEREELELVDRVQALEETVAELLRRSRPSSAGEAWPVQSSRGERAG